MASLGKSGKKQAPRLFGAAPVCGIDLERLGDLVDLFALLPVAGAEFVRLQRVEDAQRLLRVPSDVQVVDRDVADTAFRIDDEGRPQPQAGKNVVSGKRASVRVVPGGPRTIKKK